MIKSTRLAISMYNYFCWLNLLYATRKVPIDTLVIFPIHDFNFWNSRFLDLNFMISWFKLHGFAITPLRFQQGHTKGSMHVGIVKWVEIKLKNEVEIKLKNQEPMNLKLWKWYLNSWKMELEMSTPVFLIRVPTSLTTSA